MCGWFRRAGPIGQPNHQSVDSAAPLDVIDQACNFLLGKNYRQASALLRAERVNRWKLQLKHALVEKQDGRERLILSLSRHLARGRQVGEKRLDFRLA